MTKPISMSEAVRSKVWHAYVHEPRRTLAEIARTELGIGRRTFARRRAVWGWPARRMAVAETRGEITRRLPGLDASLSAVVPLSVLEANSGPDGSVDFACVARDLRRLLLGQLQALAPEPGDLDRTARTLLTIPKTVDAIQALERLQGSAAHDDSESADADELPPRSLEELRQELARHLDRLAEEEMLERDFGFDVGAGA
jgi:hypothetical protein